MQELIQYFEALEARIATLEARVSELENRPAPEPAVVEKIVEVEKPVEVIKEVPVEKIVEKVVEVVKEVPVEKPVEVSTSRDLEVSKDPELPIEETPVEITESRDHVITKEPELIIEEPASPKAAIYGKAVDDIRLAISLGDRFLYQRELFGQNAELMQRTLSELNALSSFDDAINYISRFNWDTESSTYQQFLVTLHRRFG